MHRLSDFSDLPGLEVLKDGDFAVTGKLSTPLSELCVPLRSAKYLDEVNSQERVAAVITTREIADSLDRRFAVAVCERPDDLHSEIHARCAQLAQQALATQPNIIDPTAIIDGNASIAANGVEIGPHVWIGPNAVVSAGVRIEHDCVVHAGVVLGSPGFNTGIIGGRRRIVPQLGGVRLKPFVELLPNVCIARALFGGETTLGEEMVADMHAYFAHDVQVGRRVQVCALANILGRVELGDEVYVGPSAVVSNGVKVGAGAKVSIGAVVTRDVEAGATVSGNFAVDHQSFLAHMRSIR